MYVTRDFVSSPGDVRAFLACILSLCVLFCLSNWVYVANRASVCNTSSQLEIPSCNPGHFGNDLLSPSLLVSNVESICFPEYELY